jgi:rfaE bifunctional protein kinase chain/domain/rfaE bifunctional protein nucleotidyltransferase chain/domain
MPTKVCSLPRLLQLRNAARAAGRTVVHCHGCFDIVHPGHIHHLQLAKSYGDLLILTVSGDSHVNKGPARPLIPEDLRAASLAALECVDFVYVNPDATAVGLLEQLKPDVYVKGKEYEHNRDPRFLAERDVVTRHGGRVVCSSGDVIFSSTALIGSLDSSDALQREKLLRLRERHQLTDVALHDVVDRFRDQKILVVGDYILDRYHFCEATGVAGESPMMSLRALAEQDYDGGAAVVALHLAGLGASPTLITSLSDPLGPERLRLTQSGVDVLALPRTRPNVCKHRYLVDQNKMFKVDDGAAAPTDSHAETVLADWILSAAQGASAVVFADFGYGLITAGLLDRVLPELRRTVRVLTADVSGRQTNLLRFKDVDLLCPTEREARETLYDFSSSLPAAVWNLLQSTNARNAIVTLGKQGLITFSRSTNENARLESDYFPALAAHGIDPLGCGDALLATATLTLATGGSLQAAALLGSLAAADHVQRLGNQPLCASRLLDRLSQLDAVATPREAIRLAS